VATKKNGQAKKTQRMQSFHAPWRNREQQQQTLAGILFWNNKTIQPSQTQLNSIANDYDSDEDEQIVYDLGGRNDNISFININKEAIRTTESSHEPVMRQRPIVSQRRNELSSPQLSPIREVMDASRSPTEESENISFLYPSQTELKPLAAAIPVSKVISSGKNGYVNNASEMDEDTVVAKRSTEIVVVSDSEEKITSPTKVKKIPSTSQKRSDRFVTSPRKTKQHTKRKSFGENKSYFSRFSSILDEGEIEDDIEDYFDAIDRSVTKYQHNDGSTSSLSRDRNQKFDRILHEDIMEDEVEDFDDDVDESISKQVSEQKEEEVEVLPSMPTQTQSWLQKLRSIQASTISSNTRFERSELNTLKKIKSNYGYSGKLKRSIRDSYNSFNTLNFQLIESKRLTPSSSFTVTLSHVVSIESLVLRIIRDSEEFNTYFTVCKILHNRIKDDGYGDYVDVVFNQETKSRFNLKPGKAIQIYKPFIQHSLHSGRKVICSLLIDEVKGQRNLSANELKEEIDSLAASFKC
jgi:hypothetical protein